MSFTLGTNTTGYDYPGQTYWRKGVITQWDKMLWKLARDKYILKDFTGEEGSGKPFINKNQLKTKNGDTIRCQMIGTITGLGKFGNATLEGSEKNLGQYYVDVYINQVRQGWVDDGAMSRQRDSFSLTQKAVGALGDWLAEQYERYLFNAMYYGYPPHILGPNDTYGGYNLTPPGGATAGYAVPNKNWWCADSENYPITYSATHATHVANIQAAEQAINGLTTNTALWFGPDVLEGVAAKMKVLNFKPAKYEGWEGYICFAHPYQVAQLRSNESWFEANMHAMPVGTKGNPIFSGRLANDAVGMWNNIAIFESNLVHNGSQSYFADLLGSQPATSGDIEISSTAPNVYRALFVGAEAGIVAEGVAPHIERKDNFDYNNYKGMAVAGIMGCQRADFVLDDSNATLVNQGSLVVSTCSPATSI